MELEEILKDLELSGGIVITGNSRRVSNFLAAHNETIKILKRINAYGCVDANMSTFYHIVHRAINVREIALIFGKVRNNIMIEFYEDIIRKTIECYGAEKQSVVCMEECCELVQAISKELRGKSDKGHLAEEMADVLICMEMLKIMYHVTDDELNEWVKKKQFRQLRRITESGVVTGYTASNLTAKDITCENLHFVPIFGGLEKEEKENVADKYVLGYEQAFEDLDEAILDNEICSQNMNGDCYEEIMKIMRKLRKEVRNDRE